MKYHSLKNIKGNNKKLITNISESYLIKGILFLLTLIVSLICAFKLSILSDSRTTYLPMTLWQICILYLFLIIILISFFSIYKKNNKLKRLLLKGLFVAFVFWGGMTVFNLFCSVFLSLLLMGLLILMWLNNPAIWLHNILVILGFSGWSIFLGYNTETSVVILLFLVFSIFDFVSFYKEKHISGVIKNMIEEKTILGFIVPREIINIKTRINDLKIGNNYYVFWGGEIFLSGLLAISVISIGFLNSLVVVFFSIIGFIANCFIDFKIDEVEITPTLPVIGLFTVIGYALGLLLL